MDSQEITNGIQFLTWSLPTLLILLSLSLVVARIAARKGKSQVLCVLAMVVPLVNVLTLLWLVSLTDTGVLEELTRLRARVAELVAA